MSQSFPAIDVHFYDDIAESLQCRGYAIVPDAAPGDLGDALLLHFNTLDAREFKFAGMGKDTGYQVNGFIRGDAISWLDNDNFISKHYLIWMEQLRCELNRRLFLGLFDFECHYAWYPPGSFYKKHFDIFQGSTARLISIVFYLNPDWQPEHGGELVIYSPEDGSTILERITPQHGKLVLFLSREFPHEVLPVRKTRYSVSGWFRMNNSTGNMVDPQC